jgi:hypothetical protein
MKRRIKQVVLKLLVVLPFALLLGSLVLFGPVWAQVAAAAPEQTGFLKWIGLLFPYVMSAVEMIKRIIPDKYRLIGNAALGILLGGVGSYYYGGYTGFFEALGAGIAAAGAAMGAYSIPKAIGQALGTETDK